MVPIVLQHFSGGSSATTGGRLLIYIYRDATLGGTPTWLNVDNNSAVEYHTVNTTSITGGTLLSSFTCSDATNIPLNDLNIHLFPGQALHVFAKYVSSASDTAVMIAWSEDR
jgi:hypothetical protein